MKKVELLINDKENTSDIAEGHTHVGLVDDEPDSHL